MGPTASHSSFQICHARGVNDLDPESNRLTRLLTAAEMQAVDARAVQQGLDSFALMQQASQAVADEVQAVLEQVSVKPNCPPIFVLVLAGPGNNGGDGLCAAAFLKQAGVDVRVLRLGKAPSPGSDADKALLLLDEECLSPDSPSLSEAIVTATVIVDALFGAGLTRAFDPLIAHLIDAVNESKALRIAVDVPSGLDGNTHRAFSPCVRAHRTVTFFRFKPAHLLYPGRQLCGDKVLKQIGLSDEQLPTHVPECHINAPAVFASQLPYPHFSMHKFDRGHVLVRSGPIEATGAARLSATSALCCGAGLCTLASSSEALSVNASHLTAVMLARIDTLKQWQAQLLDERINVLVIGPGNGVNNATRDTVLASLATSKSLVLDADALSCWSEEPKLLFEAIGQTRADVVLTPHAGEFARLFGKSIKQDASSRLHQARQAAVLSQAVVVYKGADTVIASPCGKACINANAPPWLATAGAGDVLAGIIAALMAQGMPVFAASCAGVWLHGRAAASLNYPLCAEQLPMQIAEELKALVM